MNRISDQVRDRAQGALLGQLIGDALGSQVEFMTDAQISQAYPEGVRQLGPSSVHGTLPGQPTDDSELALCLARTLVEKGRYDADSTLKSYRFWLDSKPFSLGRTIASALRGTPVPDSQANGALMRVSPLGIFGAFAPAAKVARWAREDAALTHVNPICGQVNALYASALAVTIRDELTGPQVYDFISEASRLPVDDADQPGLVRSHFSEADFRSAEATVAKWVRQAGSGQLPDYFPQMGWVHLAFHNALWQLRNATDFESALVETVGLGGDTDTNGAIAGAILGAVFGAEAIPQSWIDTVLACRPDATNPKAALPRPEIFWPVDCLELADKLLAGGMTEAKN